MTRKQALAVITAGVAEEGKMTARLIGVYCENRISLAAMQEAADRGLAIFQKRQQGKTDFEK